MSASLLLLVIAMLALLCVAALVVLVVWLVHRGSSTSQPVQPGPGQPPHHP